MKNITYRIVQLNTPEELYQECVRWKSQLQFIQDEQRFLDELIKDYTLPLITKELYSNSQRIIGTLSKEEAALTALLERVKEHANNVETMLDVRIDEREIMAFKEIHYYLKVEIFDYTEKYRATKEELFTSIKEIIKRGKQKQLSN